MFSMDKNLHGSTLRLHGSGRSGRIFERRVQVWELKKAGQLFDRHGSIFRATRHGKHPNRETFCSDI